MAEFLLELFSEEIPARMQARAAADLQRLVGDGLTAAGLTWSGLTPFVTPRRLAVAVDGLPTRTPDVKEERKGPKVDAPQAAIDGFLRATGLSLDRCEARETPKGKVWFAVVERPGRPTAEVLEQVIGRVLAEMPWPKSMTWGEGRFRWVRPLHHVLAVFDGQPLRGAAEPEPHSRFVFTGMTRGHRFMAPDAFPVHSVAEYRERLAAAKVVLDREERKRLILDGANALAEAEGLALRPDPGLVEEVAGLVEWPVVRLGRIDDGFMAVPDEVLVSSMRTHQRYFALVDGEGRLAPRFVVVANTETDDGGAAMVAGNERVLRARLSDAKFFWDQDRQVRLDDRVPGGWSSGVPPRKLGTMAEKSRAITASGRRTGVGRCRCAPLDRLA